MSLYEHAQNFFAAMNAHDFDTMASMISPTAEIRTPQGSFVGGQAFCGWIGGLLRALPDFTHELHGMAVESGDQLVFELHAAGHFTGPLATPDGDIPPNGRRIDVPGADFWRFKDGLIVEYRLYFDQLDFLRQMGLAPVN
jgi:steroid delta-isomerase-like uncharacterized protein